MSHELSEFFTILNVGKKWCLMRDEGSTWPIRYFLCVFTGAVSGFFPCSPKRLTVWLIPKCLQMLLNDRLNPWQEGLLASFLDPFIYALNSAKPLSTWTFFSSHIVVRYALLGSCKPNLEQMIVLSTHVSDTVYVGNFFWDSYSTHVVFHLFWGFLLRLLD